MSGSVTVPGDGGPAATVPFGTGDVLNLASQIEALLSTVQGAGNLGTRSFSGTSGPIPVPVTAPVALLNLDGNGGLIATIPDGYGYVVDNNLSSDTLTGSAVTNTVLLTSSLGGSYSVSGNSTVAASAGNNVIVATGTYLISTGTGNNTISAAGSGYHRGRYRSKCDFRFRPHKHDQFDWPGYRRGRRRERNGQLVRIPECHLRQRHGKRPAVHCG